MIFVIHSIDLTRTSDVLQSELLRLDGKSYPAYRDIEGKYRRGTTTIDELKITHGFL